MESKSGRIYNWALARTESRLAPLWIGVIFLLELFLFIPLDAVLIFFCLQNKKRIPLYVLIASIASVLSGITGYLLGHFLWDLIGPYIVPHLISFATFDRFAQHYQIYEVWAVFFGTLLPMPMKVISLSAGIFHLGFIPFVLSLLIARAIRFSLVGGAMYLWGSKIKVFIDRHFRGLFILVAAKVALGIGFFYLISL